MGNWCCCCCKDKKKGKEESKKPDKEEKEKEDAQVDKRTGMKINRLGKLQTEEEHIEEEQQRTAQLGHVEPSELSECGKTALMHSMSENPTMHQSDAQSVQFDSAYDAFQISKRGPAPKKKF